MSRINNYQELLAEQKKTEAFIAEQKEVISGQILALTSKVEPFLRLLPIINLFKKSSDSGSSSSPGTSILKMGASLAIDLLVGQKLLRKASWFTRLVIPTLLKVVSSKVIGTNGHNKKPDVLLQERAGET